MKKRVCRIWVNAGRPKGVESEEWLNYKSCKKHFRYMLRKFENIQLVKELNEMQKDSEIDQKKFWKYVNKTRKNRKNISPVADIDGSLITNPDDVVKDWGQYFEQLFANDDTEQGYDEHFKKQVKAKISQLSTENQMKEHKVLLLLLKKMK